jgi:1-acyl-sn-glycerol-3-phosphate acyltransferase
LTDKETQAEPTTETQAKPTQEAEPESTSRAEAEPESTSRDDDLGDSDDITQARDPAFVERVRPLLETYVKFFRPEVRGFEHVPEKGPFLIVGNHSGGATPPDIPILMTAWWRERGMDESIYGLFHSAFLSLPGVGPVMRRAGALEAGWDTAEAALREGAIVIVYPGGDYEAFRPFWERDRIDFAGRTGFVKLAIRMGVPIVPAVSCGAHDTTFVLTRGARLAALHPILRRFRVKTQPFVLGFPWLVSPGLPVVPMPARVVVQLCPPIDLAAELGSGAADDDVLVRKGYDRVTGVMQNTLSRLAAERPGQRFL